MTELSRRSLATVLVPLGVLLLLAGFAVGRQIMLWSSTDPERPLPAFSMTALRDPQRGIDQTDFAGRVGIMNIWASWCAPCREEHPLLMDIAAAGYPIYGINFTDDRDAALNWLDDFGDPYAFNVYDDGGQLAIQIGVSGVPETFIIDANGVIRYRHMGLLDEATWEAEFLPRLQALKADNAS